MMVSVNYVTLTITQETQFQSLSVTVSSKWQKTIKKKTLHFPRFQSQETKRKQVALINFYDETEKNYEYPG